MTFARTALATAGIALLVALAGCGGAGSKAADESGGGGTGGPAAAQRLIDDTLGPNPKASSGRVTGTIDVTVTGVPRYEQPVSLSMSGPFTRGAGGVPEARLSLGAALRGTEYGAEMILKGDDMLIGLGSTAYAIPASIAHPLRRPLASSGNALGSILDVFAIAPQRWVRNPRIVGGERLAGEDVVHGVADIDAKRFFVDVARFANVLKTLRITEIAGLPGVVGPRARAALVRSVTSARGDLYSGASDHVMRKATLNMSLKPSAADRRLLGGITTMRIACSLGVSDVGSPQQVGAPAQRGSYKDLQLTIDALSDFARKQATAGS